MLVSAGCGQKPGAAPETPGQIAPAPGESNGGTSNGAGNEAPETDMLTENIAVYYTDPEMMELIEGSAAITYKDADDKYDAAFKALQQSDDPNQIPLWEKVELNSSKLEDGNLTLDLTIPAEANLGAGGELFAVDAIKNTFFQFEEVTSLQLTVDGEQVESLMGHVELENPMTR